MSETMEDTMTKQEIKREVARLTDGEMRVGGRRLVRHTTPDGVVYSCAWDGPEISYEDGADDDFDAAWLARG